MACSQNNYDKHLVLHVVQYSHLLVSSHCTIEVVERLQLGILSEEHVALEPPGQCFGKLVLGVHTSGYSKDVVQFFERTLLGLGYEQEDKTQGSNIKAGVKGECTDRVEGDEDTREGDGEDRSPEEASGDSPRHTNFTMREREHLGRVGEWDGPFTWGVKGGEDKDKERDEA